MTTNNPIKRYPAEPIVNRGELPDPFAMPDGTHVTTREKWPERSRALSRRGTVVFLLCEDSVSEYTGAVPGHHKRRRVLVVYIR